MAEKTVYTLAEIQDLLGIGRRGVRTLIQEGEFNVLRVGNKHLILKKEFDAWLRKFGIEELAAPPIKDPESTAGTWEADGPAEAQDTLAGEDAGPVEAQAALAGATIRGNGTEEKRCYTVDDLMEMLGISRQAVYELLKRNEFRHVTAAGRYLISKKSFDNWLDTPSLEQEPEKVI